MHTFFLFGETGIGCVRRSRALVTRRALPKEGERAIGVALSVLAVRSGSGLHNGRVPHLRPGPKRVQLQENRKTRRRNVELCFHRLFERGGGEGPEQTDDPLSGNARLLQTPRTRSVDFPLPQEACFPPTSVDLRPAPLSARPVTDSSCPAENKKQRQKIEADKGKPRLLAPADSPSGQGSVDEDEDQSMEVLSDDDEAAEASSSAGDFQPSDRKGKGKGKGKALPTAYFRNQEPLFSIQSLNAAASRTGAAGAAGAGFGAAGSAPNPHAVIPGSGPGTTSINLPFENFSEILHCVDGCTSKFFFSFWRGMSLCAAQPRGHSCLLVAQTSTS